MTTTIIPLLFILLVVFQTFFTVEQVIQVKAFRSFVPTAFNRPKRLPFQRALGNRAVVAGDVDSLPTEGTPRIDNDRTVQVWNNVIDTTVQDTLHDTACQIGLGHRVFARSKTGNHNNDDDDDEHAGNDFGPTNCIEQVLDSILTELGDTSPYVEYWTRQEWRSIEAHADIDEYRAKRQQQQEEPSIRHPFRYPQHGHVLYLRVGEQVRGPTCIFPGRSSGGDLLRNITSENDDVGSASEHVELVTVPAVPGRLLRFQGDYLHAVPRPTDLWLLKFVRGSPQFDPESEWGRSVVLFNCWNEPPSEVPISRFTAETMNVEEGEIDSVCSDQIPSCQSQDTWIEMYDNISTKLDAPEISKATTEYLPTKIWLLGDLARRDHPMQTLKIEAPENIREALNERSRVTKILLRQPAKN